MKRQWHIALVALATALLLIACGRTQTQDQAVTAAAEAVAPASVDALAALGAESLRALADKAIQVDRLFAPARDNALEYLLALQSRAPDDAGVRAALIDLEPQLVIAIEQSISGGAYPEARRLIGLLERANAAAPSLSRLRETVATADAAATQRELADTAEVARTEAEATALRLEAEARPAALAAAAAVAAATAAQPPRIPTPAQAVENASVVAEPAATAIAPAATSPTPAAAPAAPPAAIAAATAASAGPTGTPRLLRDAAPEYPQMERRRRLSGQVQVAFVIDAEGEVQSTRVLSSTLPKTFERAALRAATEWKFEATGREHASARIVKFAPVGG